MVRMKPLALALAVLALSLGAAGCGSDEDASGTTESAATAGGSSAAPPEQVEQALAADLGSSGGGVHDLEDAEVRRVECNPGDDGAEWTCIVTPKQGSDLECIVAFDAETKTVTKRVCARIDN
jgi:hypothetical protein